MPRKNRRKAKKRTLESALATAGMTAMSIASSAAAEQFAALTDTEVTADKGKAATEGEEAVATTSKSTTPKSERRFSSLRLSLKKKSPTSASSSTSESSAEKRKPTKPPSASESTASGSSATEDQPPDWSQMKKFLEEVVPLERRSSLERFLITGKVPKKNKAKSSVKKSLKSMFQTKKEPPLNNNFNMMMAKSIATSPFATNVGTENETFRSPASRSESPEEEDEEEMKSSTSESLMYKSLPSKYAQPIQPLSPPSYCIFPFRGRPNMYLSYMRSSGFIRRKTSQLKIDALGPLPAPPGSRLECMPSTSGFQASTSAPETPMRLQTAFTAESLASPVASTSRSPPEEEDGRRAMWSPAYTRDARSTSESSSLGSPSAPISPRQGPSSPESLSELPVEGPAHPDFALMCAVAMGNAEEVEMILRSDLVDANVREEDGTTALMRASHAGYTDVMELLLRWGADSTLTSNTNITALHCAAASTNPKAAEMIMDMGASVNARDVCNRTPLHFAASNGRDEIYHMIVARGGNPRIQTDSGITPSILHDRHCLHKHRNPSSSD